MASINAQIKFGRVDFPVRVRPTMSTKDGTVPFKNLHKECLRPINQDKVCRSCPEHDGETVKLSADDLVKGFEASKGNFVVVTDEEVEAVSAVRSPLIVIHKFVEKPDSMWIEKSYWLEANDMSDQWLRSYALLSDVLESTKVVGLGSAALWGKERPVYVSGHLRTLQLSTLHSLPELTEAPAPVTAAPTAAEVKAAKEFIRFMTQPIEDEDMVVKADTRMKELIGAKTSGQEWVAPVAVPLPAPTVDLLADLRASMAEAQAAKAAA